MRAWHVTAAVATVLAMAVPEGLDSCGIAPPTAVFATHQRPADVRNQFLKGKLGVLQRSYRQTYLIGAFRILSGVPLTEAEVESLYPANPKNAYSYDKPGQSGWLAVRGKVPGLGAAPTVDTYKTVTPAGLVLSFPNCHEDAFSKAAATLAGLSAKWGDGDPRTLDWVRAQDQVFANCAGASPTIPAAPDAAMDPLLAAHRRYQVAAALFYSGHYRKAADAFRQIADDKDSPWREWAPYLTARALLRAGMFDGDRDAYREGKDRLLAILDDPAQGDRYDDCLALLHLWQLRVEPRARLAELGAELMKPSEEDVSQSVTDFLYAVNHRQDGTGRKWSAGEMTEVEGTSELAAWMLAMSPSPPTDAGERSVEWWRKTHNAAWLVAALANAQEKDLPELLAAARTLAPEAPAFESAAYYAISREVTRGRNENARRLADRALSRNLQRSSRNLLLALRTQVARDWTEFLRFGLRRPEPHIEEFEGNEQETEKSPVAGAAPVFDQDLIDQFNFHVPLSLWVDASSNRILPADLQLRIAQAGWTRAVVLGRYDEARKLMQRAVELQPAGAPAARGFLEPRDADETRFAAIFVVLRSPSLQPVLPDPESGVENLGRAHYLGVRCWNNPPAPPPVAAPGFFSPEQRQAGEAEWKQIHAAEHWDATFLERETVSWARRHPDDPRVPEALHRAVMASRWRCTDEQTGKYSKQAFDLLHRQYEKSEWAARTKYWWK